MVLYDANGDVVATTTTDANGDYSFPGLPDGTYTVDVTDDGNVLGGWWHSTGPVPGADNNSQSDPYPVTVAGGQTNTTGDFGYYLTPASLGNWMWLDAGGPVRHRQRHPGRGRAGDRRSRRDPVHHLPERHAGQARRRRQMRTATTSSTTCCWTRALTASRPRRADLLPAGRHEQPAQQLPAQPAQRRRRRTRTPTIRTASRWTARRRCSRGSFQDKYDFGFYEKPTNVVLLSFTAAWEANQYVKVDWVTAAELDNLGFNLYRAESYGGPRTQLNAQLIPSTVPPGSGQGDEYTWLDETAVTGQNYYYWLESVDVYGLTEIFGPASTGGSQDLPAGDHPLAPAVRSTRPDRSRRPVRSFFSPRRSIHTAPAGVCSSVRTEGCYVFAYVRNA